jgi:predicted transcriptional regulator
LSPARATRLPSRPDRHAGTGAFPCGEKNAKAVRAWEISRITTFEASPGDTVEDVAKLMAEHDIGNIAVTELGELQGVVSMQSLIQVILKENSTEVYAGNAEMQIALEPMQAHGLGDETEKSLNFVTSVTIEPKASPTA